MDCERCLALLPLVVDEEAAPADVHAVEAHLAACEPCAREARIERAFAAALAARRAAERTDGGPAAGDGLRARLRSALDSEDAARQQAHAFRAWRRGLATAIAAVGLIALGALAPAFLSSRPAPPPDIANPAQVSGTLTCLTCEVRRRKPMPGLEAVLPRDGGAADHGRLALRDAGGTVWTLVPETDEALAVDRHDLAGRRVTAFGVVEPDLRAIRVSRLSLD